MADPRRRPNSQLVRYPGLKEAGHVHSVCYRTGQDEHRDVFRPGKAFFIDFEDEMKILGTAQKEEDHLFYISDQQDSTPNFPVTRANVMIAIMAISEEHLASKN